MPNTLKETLAKPRARMLVVVVVANLMLAACASKPSGEQLKPIESPGDAAQQLATTMHGTYSTLPGDGSSNFSDRRIIVEHASEPGAWLYYQLNTGESNKLYRQRFIQLIARDENTVVQSTFTPTDAKAWESIWERASVPSVSGADYEEAFDLGCQQVWTRQTNGDWHGYVNPKTCEYFSKRRNANIYIESESILNDTSLRQTERGFDGNGEQLFGSAPGEFNNLRKLGL